MVPYEAHERLRSHRGADLTGKLRVSACAWFDYIMLEFFVGRTVSNGRGFCDLQKEKSPELVIWASSGLLYCLLRRKL